MATKPTTKPEFALLDQVDATTGQNNVVEPASGWKNYGWSYQEKPARNYFNWLHRLTHNWIDYFDDVVIRPVSFTIAAWDASQDDKDTADYICDGTDDHVQINAALAALPAYGGIVQLSSGSFIIDASINMRSGSILRGAGMGSTEIEILTNASSSFSAIIIDGDNLATVCDLWISAASQATGKLHNGIYINDAEDSRVCNVKIEDMLSGSSPAGYGYGIKFGSTLVDRCVVENCFIDDCQRDGVIMDANTNHSFISHCSITGCNEAGINCDAVRCTISECYTFDNATNILLTGSHCQVMNNIVYTTTSPGGASGIKADTAAKLVISGNIIRDNYHHGIELTGTDDSIVTNNMVDHNNQAGGSFDGINVTNSDYNNIQHNTVRMGAGSQHRYGIRLESSSNSNVIANNDCRLAGATANLSDAGTSTWWPYNSTTLISDMNRV